MQRKVFTRRDLPRRMVRIAPSILSADFARLGDEVRAAETGGADLLHIDVMDGTFVPNLTLGPAIVEKIRGITKLPFDVHLMVQHPERFVEAFADAGADYLTVHVEADHELAATVALIRDLGKKPGVVVSPPTPLSRVRQVLPQVEMLLVMTVNPGFAGQRFMAEVVPKVREARDLLDKAKLPVLLEVDGGIGEKTAKLVAAAGADVLVAGSAVFAGDGKVKERIAALRQAAGGQA